MIATFNCQKFAMNSINRPTASQWIFRIIDSLLRGRNNLLLSLPIKVMAFFWQICSYYCFVQSIVVSLKRWSTCSSIIYKTMALLDIVPVQKDALIKTQTLAFTESLVFLTCIKTSAVFPVFYLQALELHRHTHRDTQTRAHTHTHTHPYTHKRTNAHTCTHSYKQTYT